MSRLLTVDPPNNTIANTSSQNTDRQRMSRTNDSIPLRTACEDGLEVSERDQYEHRDSYAGEQGMVHVLERKVRYHG